MVLGIVEIAAYGIIGYATLVSIITMAVRKDMPEAPMQAVVRAGFCIPGLIAMYMLAFMVAGHTDATMAEQVAFGILVPGGVALPYDVVTIDLWTENRLIVEREYVGNTGSSNSTKDTGEIRTSVTISEAAPWVMTHTVFMAAIFAWILYQMGVMFSMIFRRPGE